MVKNWFWIFELIQSPTILFIYDKLFHTWQYVACFFVSWEENGYIFRIYCALQFSLAFHWIVFTTINQNMNPKCHSVVIKPTNNEDCSHKPNYGQNWSSIINFLIFTIESCLSREYIYPGYSVVIWYVKILIILSFSRCTVGIVIWLVTFICLLKIL